MIFYLPQAAPRVHYVIPREFLSSPLRYIEGGTAYTRLTASSGVAETLGVRYHEVSSDKTRLPC